MSRLLDDALLEYLEVSSAVLSGTPLVLAAWVLVDSLAINQVVLGVSNGSTDGHVVELSGAAGGDPVSALTIAGGLGSSAQTGVAYSTGVWQHVLALFASATDRRIWLSGGNRATDAASYTPSGLDRTTVGQIGSGSRYVSGRVAEPAIWDLSPWPGATDSDKADEFERVAVPALANYYAPSFFRLGLVAYWRLTRDRDIDRAGGYDLTAYNTPSIADHPPMIYPRPSMPVAIAAAAGFPFDHYYRMRRR